MITKVQISLAHRVLACLLPAVHDQVWDCGCGGPGRLAATIITYHSAAHPISLGTPGRRLGYQQAVWRKQLASVLPHGPGLCSPNKAPRSPRWNKWDFSTPTSSWEKSPCCPVPEMMGLCVHSTAASISSSGFPRPVPPDGLRSCRRCRHVHATAICAIAAWCADGKTSARGWSGAPWEVFIFISPV